MLGDEHALSLVGQASFLEAFAGTLEGADVVAHCRRQHASDVYAQWLGDGHTQIWIAEAKSAPIGYLVLTTPSLPLPDLTAEDREIKRVYLLHRFQGQGVGRALMRQAADAARAKGVRRLLLGVYSRNEAAIAFYTALGYVTVGERAFTVGSNTYHDRVLAFALR